MVRVLGSRRELRVAGTRDERIAAIAEAQRGYVARRQLRAAGVSPDAIDRAISAGRLHRRHRGVYRYGPEIEVPLGAEAAALLALRDGAVLSHHTAASLWGLRVPTAAEIHILVAGGPATAATGVLLHRTRALDLDHTRVHRRLPLTSPARTLIDLAGHLTDRQLEFAVDQAITERLVHVSELRRALELLTHAVGRSRILALLDAGAHPTITRSVAEERLLALVREAGLPAPLVNARVAGFEVDFYWPQARFVVEVDGFRFHSTHHRFERDRTKDGALQAAGIGTMRVTWWGLERQRTATIVRIGQALALRSAT